MMKRLELTHLADRKRQPRLTLLYKILNNLVAIPPDDFIEPNYQLQGTRQNHTKTFQTIIANSEIFKNSYFPRTVMSWNSLSEQL